MHSNLQSSRKGLQERQRETFSSVVVNWAPLAPFLGAEERVPARPVSGGCDGFEAECVSVRRFCIRPENGRR
ncbi:hypothetical protein SLA2020_452490 [Shorea laevis]